MADLLKDILPTIITGLIAAASGYFIARTNKKGAREILLIEQLQEEVERLHKRVDEQDKRLAKVSRTSSAKSEYISLLRLHIIEGKLPPPPDYPQLLSQEEVT